MLNFSEILKPIVPRHHASTSTGLENDEMVAVKTAEALKIKKKQKTEN